MHPTSSLRHPELICGFGGIALLLSGCAVSPPVRDLPVLPPEVIAADRLSRFPVDALHSFSSRPLWTAGALDGYEERYRVTIYGISLYWYQVAVDHKTDGATSSRAKTLFQKKLVRDRRVAWRSVDYDKFKELVAAADLWNTPDERWEIQKQEGTICLDGTAFVLERLDWRGYAVSQGTSCDRVPEGFIPLFTETARAAQLRIGGV